MNKNIFKIIIRSLKKDKFYSLINITGLSVGIACSLLILLYVVDELSFDRFHKDADRIYRIVTKGKLNEDETFHSTLTPAPLAEQLRISSPAIEEVTRILPYGLVIKHNGEPHKLDKGFLADSSFFRVFDHKILLGNPDNALVEPNSLVLTESTAIRYFGKEKVIDGTILGKQLEANGLNWEITGVIKDIPNNSHIQFDFLASMSSSTAGQDHIWINLNFYTYVKLNSGIDTYRVIENLHTLIKEYARPMIIQYLSLSPELFEDEETAREMFHFLLQPLTSIHLHSNLIGEIGVVGDINNLYFFSAIAVFILLLACINFMNLSTARSAKRSIEVGIRKTMGSTSGMLIRQFLIESSILTVIAMLIGLGLAEGFRIPFNMISGKSLSINVFNQPWIALAIIGITLLVSLLSGLYPAFFLTAFKPVEVLKGTHRKSGSSNFRSGLVIFQFIISISLIICTTLVYKQMTYMQQYKLGFDKENVIILPNGWDHVNTKKAIKKELLKQSSVQNVSISSGIPSNIRWSSVMKAEGDLETDHSVNVLFADYDFIPVMGLDIIHGRNFSEEIHADDSATVLVNQAAAKQFGWIKDNCKEAVGKRIESINGQTGERMPQTIIGVIQDFNFESLRKEIGPIVVYPAVHEHQYVSIKLKPGDLPQRIDMVKSIVGEISPNAPFEYTFLDSEFENLFESEKKLGKVIAIFSVLAILIACLGLLGLSAFTAEQRTKELGIRKVMGASIQDLILLLNKDFTKLVIISFIISIPVTWFFMDRWLNSFNYKTSVGIGPFIMAGLVAIAVTWITVSYQSLSAALTNPTNSLRSE